VLAGRILARKGFGLKSFASFSLMLISLLANSWRVFLFLLSITDVRSLDKIERKGLYVLSGTGLAWKGCTSLKSSKVFLVPGRVTGGLVASWTDEFHLGCG
jgi:hypothetical protein